jgi:hypothetical protein
VPRSCPLAFVAGDTNEDEIVVQSGCGGDPNVTADAEFSSKIDCSEFWIKMTCLSVDAQDPTVGRSVKDPSIALKSRSEISKG